MLRIKHINTINRFALLYGYGWRTRLFQAIAEGKHFPARTSEHEASLIRQACKLAGNEFIENFQSNPQPYKRLAHLVKDRVQRYSGNRTWYVNAWRLVDHRGADVLQPWARTKAEARDMARELQVYLLETRDANGAKPPH